MSLFKKHQVVTAFAIINLLFCSNLFAANIYVDKTLSSSCNAGNYSTTNRSCNGSAGNAYKTIQQAVDNMNASDDIFIRGGTYYENVLLSGSTAPNGTANNYASMQSYPGEWAIIDGQNKAQYTIGKIRSGRDSGNDLAYWKFERLGITGGTTGNSDGGAGLYISGGPFIIRYNYIHDNLAPNSAGNNPGGIVGYAWRDSIVEYNYFDDNGIPAPDASGNSANLTIFGDYRHNTIGQLGFTDSNDTPKRNEVRYNYFSGSAVGYRTKGGQLYTGRNPGTADYVDTYKDLGNKIHHNYFIGQRRHALVAQQDFEQIYNNIFDAPREAIVVNYQPDHQFYKVITYNNTIINPSGKGVVRYGCDWFSAFVENEKHYGWDLNNIVGSSDKVYDLWFTGTAFNVFNGCGGNRTPYSNPDISNYINSHNYIYSPDHPDIFDFTYPGTYYTAAEFEAQTVTGEPKVAYTNPYDADNPLYAGTTGANKFITL